MSAADFDEADFKNPADGSRQVAKEKVMIGFLGGFAPLREKIQVRIPLVLCLFDFEAPLGAAPPLAVEATLPQRFAGGEP
jgi:hypothetical protein